MIWPIHINFIRRCAEPSASRIVNALRVNSSGDLNQKLLPTVGLEFWCKVDLCQTGPASAFGDGWLRPPAIDLRDRLKLDSIMTGQCFRFRLRANPTVNRQGKRLGLLRLEEQEKWIMRKGEQHGFSLPKLAAFDFSETTTERVDVRVSQEQMLDGEQHAGNGIRVYSVLYDGVLTVTRADDFRKTLQAGIGHGKVMGLGLLSVAPIV